MFDHVCVIYDPRTYDVDSYVPLAFQLPSFDIMRNDYDLIYSEMVGCFTYECGLDYKNDSIILLDDNFLLPNDISPQCTPCHGAYTAALHSIPQIIEKECTWEQVWEIRKDIESMRKLRKLRSWFSESMQSTSATHAQEIIESYIDDYKWAIEKHGLVTSIGVLKSVIKSDSILSASGAAIISNLVAGETAAVITAGIILTSNAATEVASYLVNRREIDHGKKSEVAILFEINEKFSSPNK